ncbi:TetR/AcrR family transcriptional regulator [Nocardia puris]|uniref:TetR/AcrR family transcriptional regulator n=1 Tax=Nocardia TaxID=1817 RepID=UPI0004A6E0AC|nr:MULTISPECIES: TetR/AcrR family transcriptional regulator [Nocardia]MBF6137198.1 TetR/AcrR family transcriptional regulator [Nocardia otitidiscaviarum]MBF6181802.1 TetR/AcrR family transcriptional regulator [Nocardia otitidiscaviarum]MBF6461695.1 TetR/AcrR family transcriptional regulator [Nocardia puris]MBF6488096.1 TetR/AcrR family transcriptional regulator [Nocardia otitidiscaviarum]
MTDPDPATSGPRTADDEQADPRLARSRNRLLDAATHLLATGGVEAVTVEAVTRASKVARATLYRHFGSTTQLLAATFERLLPHVDTPTGTASVREQLIALLTTQADLIEQAPVQMTTLAWLAMGSIGDDHPDPDHRDPDAVTSLRARVIEQYRHPFDQVLTSPEARATLGELDTTFAIIELLGPIVFARLTGLRTIDHDDCTRLVDNFLTTHRTHTTVTATDD